MHEANQWITDLQLAPHPEGGYYKRTESNPQMVTTLQGERPLHTSILFLLDTDSPSHFHRLKSDEMWFYHAGAPLTVHCIFPDGHYEAIQIGPDIHKGQRLSFSVPAGTIFGSTVESDYALVSCVVTPGFDFADFELFTQDELNHSYPDHHDIITRLAYETLPSDI